LAEPSLLGNKSVQHSKLRLEDEYPKLLQELNDPNSKIPAYQRFQDSESCILREDLKKLKEEHFRRNYERELKSPLNVYD
jgi:hypothetical protein